MEPELARSLARIGGTEQDADQKKIIPKGAGFLASEGYVLTCAHVANAALGRNAFDADKPDTPISLDFPLVGGEGVVDSYVHRWQPAVHGSREGDIAVLRLAADPPASTTPADIRRFDTTWMHPFAAIGFPPHHPSGVVATGRLVTLLGTWVQIEDTKTEGKRVEGGYSGAAVWDAEEGAVVGMVVAEDRDPAAKTAFMIPTRVLMDAWPELEARVQSNQAGRTSRRIGEVRRRRAEAGAHREEGKPQRVVGHRTDDLGASFRDREAARERLGRLLADPNTRVVSILGRPGMGKTALAGKVLGDLEKNQWPHTAQGIPVDGVAYLSARTERITLDRFFHHSARLIGGDAGRLVEQLWSDPSQPLREKVQSLMTALGDGYFVFLLDNAEDLLDEQRHFADPGLQLFFECLIGSASQAKLVVTSRRPIAFPRAALRRDERIELREGLPSGEAVSLLRELDPNDEYGLASASDERLEDIADRVRGVPLALQEIVNRLANDPSATLDGVVGDFYSREDFVEELVAAGIRRLAGDARKVVDALAVLGRPVEPVAIDAVLAPFVPGLDAQPVLNHLIRSQVVSLDRVSGRVFLHALDEAYAYDHLPNDGHYNVRELERSAADYYSRLGTTPTSWRSIDDIEPELLEFTHRVRAGDFDAAATVLERLDAETLGERGEGMLASRMCTQLEGKLTDPRLELVRLYAAGRSKSATGDHPGAVTDLRRAAKLAEDLGERATARDCLAWTGASLRHQGSLPDSRAALEAAVKLNAGGEDEYWIHNELSLVCAYLGDFGRAFDVAEWLEKKRRLHGSPQLEAAAGDAMSLALLGVGDYVGAAAAAERSVRGYLELGYTRTADYPRNVLALARLGCGDRSEAAELLDEIRVRARENFSPRLEAIAEHNLAHARRGQSRLNEAASAGRTAVAIFERLGALETAAAKAHARSVEALRAGRDTDAVQALLACARDSSRNPDLYPSRLLAHEALALARAQDDADGVREALAVQAKIEAADSVRHSGAV